MDISSLQSNIYTVPITAAALSAIINGVGVTALEISGTITVSDANPLLVNNPNLIVSGAGAIHQADGVGVTVDTRWYWNEPPDTMTFANEVRFWALKSWSGVNFTGQWWKCDWQVDDVTVSDCRMPHDIYLPHSYTTSVERCRFERLSGTKRILGMLDNCYAGYLSDAKIISVVGCDNVFEHNTSGVIFFGFAKNQTGNIVRYNNIDLCPNEVICYDCDRGHTNIANGTFTSAALAPDNPQIGRLTCDASVGGYDLPVGSLKGPIAILPGGVYYFVLRSGSGYVDVDLTGRYGASTFLAMQQGQINFQWGFAFNKIYGNSWTLNYAREYQQDPAGVSLWGGCVDNEIYGNTGPGSYDCSVICDAKQDDTQGELTEWEIPLACINSNNYWHENDHAGSNFDIYSFYGGVNGVVTWDVLGNNPAMIQEKTTVINNTNIGILQIYDALDTKWINPDVHPAQIVTANPGLPAGTPHGTYITFTSDSTPPVLSTPKGHKLRSPSGGKIRGKGAGKVSGKPQ